MNSQLIALLTMSALLTVACSKTESEDVKTSGFHATYTIRGNNQNSVTCSATLQVGGSTGTYLDLSGADSITCNGNAMSRSELLGMITYSATVPYVVGGTYTIVLNREGEDPYSASAILPEAITGMSPSASTSYQKGTAISPSWTPSSNAADEMIVSLSYSTGDSSYSFSQNDTAPENGASGFSSSQTQLNPNVAGTWTGSIEYSRRRSGSMPEGLDGSIRASQTATVAISLTD